MHHEVVEASGTSFRLLYAAHVQSSLVLSSLKLPAGDAERAPRPPAPRLDLVTARVRARCGVRGQVTALWAKVPPN